MKSPWKLVAAVLIAANLCAFLITPRDTQASATGCEDPNFCDCVALFTCGDVPYMVDDPCQDVNCH